MYSEQWEILKPQLIWYFWTMFYSIVVYISTSSNKLYVSLSEAICSRSSYLLSSSTNFVLLAISSCIFLLHQINTSHQYFFLAVNQHQPHPAQQSSTSRHNSLHRLYNITSLKYFDASVKILSGFKNSGHQELSNSFTMHLEFFLRNQEFYLLKIIFVAELNRSLLTFCSLHLEIYITY